MVDNDHNKHDLQSAYHSELKGVVCKGSSVEVTAVWGNMTVSVPLLARFSPLSSLNNFCSLTLTCAYQHFATRQSCIHHNINNNNILYPALQILTIKTAY